MAEKEKELIQPFDIYKKVDDNEQQPVLIQPFEILEKKNPDEIKYLFIYEGEIEKEYVKSFDFITGRDAIYDFIKGMVEYIDLEESLVMAEGVPFDQALNVREFMIYMKTTYYSDDKFDIYEYIVED